MARTKYSDHAIQIRREGTKSRDEYLLTARSMALRGQELPQTKLLDMDVVSIRSAARQRESLRNHIRDNLSNEALAKSYGVHIRNIERILSYETWSHIP